MAGTYNITKVLNDVVGKYTAMVSFNGNAAERYEIDSLEPKEIDRVLQEVADDSANLTAEKAAAVAATGAIELKDGKIVV